MNERIEKYFGEQLSRQERLELLWEIERDKKLHEEFSNYQNTHALLALSDLVIDREDSHRGYRIFIRGIKKRIFYHRSLKVCSYAAATLLIILSVHYYHIFYYSSGKTQISEVSLFVPAGQRVSMTLDDGTIIWLNSQTRLTYPAAFAKNERKVKIEGEAYLEVAEDSSRPFIVSTKGIEMKVLGTTFNVYSYPKEPGCRVSLLEGSLQVYFPKFNTKGVTLSPSEQVTIRGRQMVVSPITYYDYFLWKDGIISFNNELLSDILKRLELYYDIDIEVKDPSILNWEYTGKFRQRDGIEEILRLMQRIRAFTVVKDEENNKITLSK